MSSGDERQEDATAPVSASQFAQLIETIQASQERLEAKFADFRSEVRSEVRQSQEAAAVKALKSVHQDKPYVWRKKGHEEQFSFNGKVDAAISVAQAELDGVTASEELERAKKALEKGKQLIGERQKLIKINISLSTDITHEYRRARRQLITQLSTL